MGPDAYPIPISFRPAFGAIVSELPVDGEAVHHDQPLASFRTVHRNRFAAIQRGSAVIDVAIRIDAVDASAPLCDGTSQPSLVRLSLHPLRHWPPAFKEWSARSVRDTVYASPQFPRLLNPDSLRNTIAQGVSSGLLAYVGKKGEEEY